MEFTIQDKIDIYLLKLIVFIVIGAVVLYGLLSSSGKLFKRNAVSKTMIYYEAYMDMDRKYNYFNDVYKGLAAREPTQAILDSMNYIDGKLDGLKDGMNTITDRMGFNYDGTDK